jgi:4-amino-4-deoxy-L-arabinose transferase-like glycosyltransferase
MNNEITYSQKAIYCISLIAVIFLISNSCYTFFDQDEAAYAGFARNMVLHGDCLNPHFEWSDVHRKPPLHFWLIALSYKIFGFNEFATRLSSTLSIVACLFVIFFSGRKIFGDKLSFHAILILSSTYLFMALAKVAVTDALLLLLTTICAISIIHVLLYRDIKYAFLCWISFAFALLTKGPPIVIFTLLFVSLLFVFHPLRKNLLKLYPLVFLPLSFVPLLVWGYACYQSEEGKQFIIWMIDWYILKRVSGSVFGQTGPPGTHLLGLFVFFLPFICLIPYAIKTSFVSLYKKENEKNLLLGIWFISAWLLFEFTPSKLPAYVIAAHVPLAFLVGIQFESEVSNRLKNYIQLGFNLLIPIVFIVLVIIVDLKLIPSIIFILIGSVFIYLNIKNFTKASHNPYHVRYLYQSVGLQLAIWLFVVPMMDGFKNITYSVANEASKIADRKIEIVVGNDQNRPPSLFFYLYHHFDTMREAFLISEIKPLYEEPVKRLFILKPSNFEELKQVYPALQYKIVKPKLTLFNQMSTYYLVKNY